MPSWLDAKTVQHHLDTIAFSLRFLMNATKEIGKDEDAQNGLMILNLDNARKTVDVRWVNACDVPDYDPKIKDMANMTRPGDCTLMTVLIQHDKGARSAYTLTPMVRWHTFPQGYAVLYEAHYPPVKPQDTQPLSELLEELFSGL